MLYIYIYMCVCVCVCVFRIMPSHMLAAGVCVCVCVCVCVQSNAQSHACSRCVCVLYHNMCARHSNQLCANIHICLAPKSGSLYSTVLTTIAVLTNLFSSLDCCNVLQA